MQRVPLSFFFYFFNVTYKTGRVYRVPLSIFFGTVRLFSMSQKGHPFGFFDFCNRMYVNKTQRLPPFAFFGIMRHFSEEKSELFFKKKFFLFPVGEKWCPSLIEHGRHPLGVSELFSELFVDKCWECFKTFALFEP